jgi:hypothetical protein
MQLAPKFHGGLVKLPPGFPLSELPHDAMLTYLGSSGDCRECLVGLGSMASAQVQAVEVESGQTLSAMRAEVEQARLPVQELGPYLFEPSPTLVRSHLFPVWAAPLGLWQIDANIAYVSGDAFLRVKTMLKNHGIRPMTLKKRGVEVEPAVELKRLKIDSGEPGILFYTRMQNQKVAILTQMPQKK